MTFSFQSTRKEDTLYARSQSIQLTVSLYNGTIVTVIHCICISFALTGYIEDLMKETLRQCKEGIIETLPHDTPAPLSMQYERPDKLTAIKSHKSRFSL